MRAGKLRGEGSFHRTPTAAEQLQCHADDAAVVHVARLARGQRLHGQLGGRRLQRPLCRRPVTARTQMCRRAAQTQVVDVNLRGRQIQAGRCFEVQVERIAADNRHLPQRRPPFAIVEGTTAMRLETEVTCRKVQIDLMTALLAVEFQAQVIDGARTEAKTTGVDVDM